jgi:hypothetical protein
MSEKKFLELNLEVGVEDGEATVDSLSIKPVELKEILASLPEDTLYSHYGLIRVDNTPTLGLSKTAKLYLDRAGWVHRDLINNNESVSDQIPRYYYFKEIWSNSRLRYGTQIVSLPSYPDLWDEEIVRNIVDGATIVRSVDPDAVLPEHLKKHLHKTLAARKKSIQEKERARQLRADRKAAKLQAKKIEEARKLLADIGEIPNPQPKSSSKS